MKAELKVTAVLFLLGLLLAIGGIWGYVREDIYLVGTGVCLASATIMAAAAVSRIRCRSRNK